MRTPCSHAFMVFVYLFQILMGLLECHALCLILAFKCVLWFWFCERIELLQIWILSEEYKLRELRVSD